MRPQFFFGISCCLVFLIGGGPRGWVQTVPGEQPAQDTVAKLIAQLGADDFSSRQQASRELEKLGHSVMPALRKALTKNGELETKRRIEKVVIQIENGLVKTEVQRWQELDESRRGIKDRLVKILAKTPRLKDQRVASAVYLLTVGRQPTGEEVTQAKKQFREFNNRLAPALQLARALVKGKEFNKEVAAVNGRLLKAQKEIAAETDLLKQLIQLNKLDELVEKVGASLTREAKSDEQLVDLAFLLVLSRFPEPQQLTFAVNYLKHAENRANEAADLVWALVNNMEFWKVK